MTQAHPSPTNASVAVILGSAFSKSPPAHLDLNPLIVATPWGEVEVHEVSGHRTDRSAYLLFRHGLPHHSYPQNVNFRAQAVALKLLGCQALLVTSSVGVLDPAIPLDQHLLVSELLMPDNRLPDGSLCTTLTTLPIPLSLDSQSPDFLRPGHLVLRGPLCATDLDAQVVDHIKSSGSTPGPSVTFAYVAGPRTKTAAENRYWSSLGAQVNSMSVGPELILANELGIPTSALVIGHKYSSGRTHTPKLSQPHNANYQQMSDTLNRSHQALTQIVSTFLSDAKPVAFPHYIYRYHT